MNSYPKIVVIGPKGAGKSSLISALIFEDIVSLQKENKITSYKVENFCNIFYEFIDTPSFTFVKEIIQELKSLKAPSHKRFEVLKNFVLKYKDEPLLEGDIALLQTIIKSDGVVFVSNASKKILSIQPLLELLLYIKKPILPVINRCENSSYLQEYKTHFKLFFNSYFIFNPMDNSLKNILAFYKRLTMLNCSWSNTFIEFSKYLKKRQQNRLKRAAEIITTFVFALLEFQIEDRCNIYYLKNNYIKRIQEKEFAMHQMLLEVWEHKNILLKEDILPIPGDIKIEERILQPKKAKSFIKNYKEILNSFSLQLEPMLQQLAFFSFPSKNVCSKSLSGYVVKEQDEHEYIYQLGPIKDVDFYFHLIQRALNVVKNISSIPYFQNGLYSLKEEFKLSSNLKEHLKKYIQALLDKKESKESFERFIYSLLQIY